MKIEGAVVLITGGASGIGENMAHYYSERKAIVYICDLQEVRGNKIQSDSNSKIKFIKCDIASEENVKSMFEIIKSEQGRIDILINSAGIIWGELIASEKNTHNKDNFEKVMKINTYGSFLVSKHAAKLMIEKNTSNKESACNGNIIFIASIAGYEGQRGQTAYSASKAALIGMTLPMARDLGRYRIRVNSIAPGIIQTPMAEGIGAPKILKTILDATPIRAIGQPVHISQASEFIVTCDFVNGTTLRVDGGCRLPNF